jgi:hypothetical protein
VCEENGNIDSTSNSSLRAAKIRIVVRQSSGAAFGELDGFWAHYIWPLVAVYDPPEPILAAAPTWTAAPQSMDATAAIEPSVLASVLGGLKGSSQNGMISPWKFMQ